jgi:hypothetical protein
MPAGNERGKMLPWSCQIASRFFKKEVPKGSGAVAQCSRDWSWEGLWTVSKVSLGARKLQAGSLGDIAR